MKNIIPQIYQKIQDGFDIHKLSDTEKSQIQELINLLDTGKIRVCEKINSSNGTSSWSTQSWIKQGILLYFRLQNMNIINCGDINYYDKIPTKKWTGTEGVRVVPHALARKGSFIEPGAILMPSYINIGAYVGSGTMVDTWATVGSCAQIGKNVHLSGGVGIGGVLEPIQANPVVIEDNVFIGSRCIVVEGAWIQESAVLGAGVTITSSTKIIDVTSAQSQTYQGVVPTNSVVIPGTYLKKYPAGEFGVPCALIIGKRKASTDLKTSLTDALRDFQVSI